VSPGFRDPLGLDGSPKPGPEGGRQLLLRRLLPGLDFLWAWRESTRARDDLGRSRPRPSGPGTRTRSRSECSGARQLPPALAGGELFQTRMGGLGCSALAVSQMPEMSDAHAEELVLAGMILSSSGGSGAATPPQQPT
jgi:hypothetical protein